MLDSMYCRGVSPLETPAGKSRHDVQEQRDKNRKEPNTTLSRTEKPDLLLYYQNQTTFSVN